MIYFDSKYLAEKLKLNLAKWKRWSREFLPPDPLGGYQSGYARQFSYKDAFRVYLGGHLVGVLKFTIPEARQVLTDLDAWMNKHGFYAIPADIHQCDSTADHIYIYDRKNGKFAYAIRTIVARYSDQSPIHTETYSLTITGASRDILDDSEILHARVILIRSLHRLFLKTIAPQDG